MRIFLLSALMFSLLLSGCAPALIISSVAGTGMYLGYQHSKVGGIQFRFKNFYLESTIQSVWAEAKLDEPFLDIVGVYGTPVIIGAATSKENLEKAKALVFMKSDNVQCLADGMKIGEWNRDLALKVRVKLMFNFNVSARNYYVAAMKNQVWVVGVTNSQEEKREVIQAVRSMDGVEVFRHYIVVVNESCADGYVIRE